MGRCLDNGLSILQPRFLLHRAKAMIAAKLYRFSIDKLNGRFISGWCFNRLIKTRPVSIVAAADDLVLGRFTNHTYRKDLIEEKLHPSGICGFDCNFPVDFDPRSHSKFHLYFDSFNSPVATIDCSEIELLQPTVTAPICFMHIPKTAGSSFNAFARECFSADQFYTHLERLDDGDRKDVLKQARYLAGHLPLLELARIVDLNRYKLYAILREPYSHLHSHLNYLKGVRQGSSLESYYGYRHNQTIKTLSDTLNHIDFEALEEIKSFVAGISSYQLDFFDNIQTRYFLDYRPERVTQKDLDRACDNISRFSLVGLTEGYDQFLEVVCRTIGIPTRSQDLQSNKSDYYHLFDHSDGDIKTAFLPLVHYDLKLYELVSKKFWQ